MHDSVIEQLLAIVRLGDADRRGWWRSHSVDDAAQYVLGEAFPATWRAAGVELAMESARLRHEQLLERSTRVHVFSDYLPYHRRLRDWLIERKLERDDAPLFWLTDATTAELVAKLPVAADGEKRAGGLYLGQVRRSDLEYGEAASTTLEVLLGGYAIQDGDFIAPYVDLIDS